MSLPETVRIGAIDYRVLEVAELAGSSGNLYGDIDYGRCRIRISADEDVQYRLVTFWHEVLHGILKNAGIDQDEQDEARIRTLSFGIVQVLRDNPTLAHGATDDTPR